MYIYMNVSFRELAANYMANLLCFFTVPQMLVQHRYKLYLKTWLAIGVGLREGQRENFQKISCCNFSQSFFKWW